MNASKLLSKITTYLCYSFILLSVLFLVYNVFQIYINQSNSSYVFLGLSFLSFMSFLFLLFSSEAFRINSMLTVTSVLSCVFVFEIFLNAVVDNPTHTASQEVRRRGSDFDDRTKFDVYTEMVKADPRVTVNVPPGYRRTQTTESPENIVFPLAGISNRTTLYCNESGEYTVYESDRFGFNNPDEQWDHEHVDWVITGDSFAHGACVPVGADIAGRIRAKTHQTVLNLGYGGNGPLTELAALREYLNNKSVKFVLWMYYEGNDLNDLAEEIEENVLRNYLNSNFSQNLENRQPEIDRFLETYIFKMIPKAAKKQKEEKEIADSWINQFAYWTRNVRLYNTRRLISDFIKENFATGNIDTSKLKLFSEIIAKAQDLTEMHHGTFYFVYLPRYERYFPPRNDHGFYQERDRVLAIVKSIGITTIDLHDLVFKGHADPLSLFPFRISNHYNSEGYDLVADAILNAIIAPKD